MTTAEKTRLLAERVMGWGLDLGDSWSPLTDLSDAGEVLEAMQAKGFLVRIYVEPDTNIVEVLSAEGDRMLFVACNPLPTAICHAALLAHEVKEEEL